MKNNYIPPQEFIYCPGCEQRFFDIDQQGSMERWLCPDCDPTREPDYTVYNDGKEDYSDWQRKDKNESKRN